MAKKTLMEKASNFEGKMVNEVTQLIQECMNKTGRVPVIEVEFEGTGCKDVGRIINVPVFNPDTDSTHPQGTAVKKLIDYCMDIGDWSNRTDCKRWIVKKINSSNC